MSVLVRNELIVGCLLVMVAFAFPLLWPRETWRWSAAWQYKNPEAHEPSEALYFAQQIMAGIWVFACLIALVNLIQIPDPNSPGEKAKRERLLKGIEEVIHDFNRRNMPWLDNANDKARDRQKKSKQPHRLE